MIITILDDFFTEQNDENKVQCNNDNYNIR